MPRSSRKAKVKDPTIPTCVLPCCECVRDRVARRHCPSRPSTTRLRGFPYAWNQGMVNLMCALCIYLKKYIRRFPHAVAGQKHCRRPASRLRRVSREATRMLHRCSPLPRVGAQRETARASVKSARGRRGAPSCSSLSLGCPRARALFFVSSPPPPNTLTPLSLRSPGGFEGSDWPKPKT